MSIPVAAEDLPEVTATFGSAHLLTASTDGKVKAVTVDPQCNVGAIVVRGPGRRSCANVTANDRVTVLYPPTEHHGFSLLVDGRGTVEGEDVHVVVESAVLHRPPSHADGPPPPGS